MSVSPCLAVVVTASIGRLVVDKQGCELAERLIRRKVKQLVGHYGLRSQDREDLEHDLWVGVLESDGRGDPSRREFSFLAKVIDNAAASLIRHRTRECRDYRREQHCKEGSPANTTHDLRTRKSSPPPSDLEIDLREAILSLPDIPKWVVTRLCDHSMTENAEAMNMSRAKLYELLGHARQLLKHLEDYLELPDTSATRGVFHEQESS